MAFDITSYVLGKKSAGGGGGGSDWTTLFDDTVTFTIGDSGASYDLTTAIPEAIDYPSVKVTFDGTEYTFTQHKTEESITYITYKDDSEWVQLYCTIDGTTITNTIRTIDSIHTEHSVKIEVPAQ